MDSARWCGFLAAGCLVLTLLGDPTAACSCSPRHPQTAYCNADVVIKGKFVGFSKISTMLLRYEIKTTKVYKGFKDIQDVRFLYTHSEENLCGYQYDGPFTSEEYVFAGMLDDNKVTISLCSFIQPYSQLTPAQKRGLSLEYSKGCNCIIQSCWSPPCSLTSDRHCLWTDGVQDGNWDGHQAKRMACVPKPKNSNFCNWRSLSS